MLLSKIRNVITGLGYHSKPDFIIVGAQKAGTTALFSILKQHTQLTGALTKEVHFFDTEEMYSEKNYSFYHRYFPLPHKLDKGNLVFEATPSYLYHQQAAERIFKYDPEMKIIMSLRNPVYRALSAWNMYHHYGKNNKKYSHLHDRRSFTEAINSELERAGPVTYLNDKFSYVNRGVYYPQVKKYFEVFPKENILIIEHNELKNNHDQVIKSITAFLKVKNEALKPLERLKSEQDNKALYANELRQLEDFYRPHNAMLYELIGKEYNWRVD
jgi:hypothetical protein